MSLRVIFTVLTVLLSVLSVLPRTIVLPLQLFHAPIFGTLYTVCRLQRHVLDEFTAADMGICSIFWLYGRADDQR